MIDTHCHLSDPRLLDQLDAVMQRAATAGVNEIVTIGTHPDDWPTAMDVARKHKNVRCAIGVHPCYCHEVDFADVSRLRELMDDPTVVALGEMGLDYFHADAPKDIQHKFFVAQLELAAEFSKPVVVHSRNAIDDCIDVMKSFPTVTAVYHCFTGNAAEAQRIVDSGYFIGFTGVLTFRNAPELREIAAKMPLEQVVVETDAPWLSPEPFRKQKINEPALVIHTAKALADVRGLSIEEIDRITTANAHRLYRWERS